MVDDYLAAATPPATHMPGIPPGKLLLRQLISDDGMPIQQLTDTELSFRPGASGAVSVR